MSDVKQAATDTVDSGMDVDKPLERSSSHETTSSEEAERTAYLDRLSQQPQYQHLPSGPSVLGASLYAHVLENRMESLLVQ